MSTIGSFLRDPFTNPTDQNQRHARSNNGGNMNNTQMYRATMPNRATATNNSTSAPSAPDPSKTILRMVLYMGDGTDKVFPVDQINPNNTLLTSILEYNLNTFIGRFWKHPQAPNDTQFALCDENMVAFAASQGINARTPEEAAQAFGYRSLLLEVDKNDPSKPKVVNGQWFEYTPPQAQQSAYAQPQPQPQQQRQPGTYAQPAPRPQQGNANT